MSDILFIDPQSNDNLSLYDAGVLSRVEGLDITLFGSSRWNTSKIQHVKMNLWFNYHKYTHKFKKGLSYALTIFKIYRYAVKNRPKVVHIQWIRLWSIDWFFLNLLKKLNIKVIYTAHNILPHKNGERYRKNFQKYYKRVDKIIVHSETTKIQLSNEFDISKDKIVVIPHGVIATNMDKSQTSKRKNEIRDNYNLNDKIIFSMLGVQSYYKGCDLLIDVWSKERKLNQNNNIKLIFAGVNDGIDYSPVNGIDNVLILNGNLPSEDFQAILEISDVIILPYRIISQSGVLFSAISNNVPVIVSNAGGLAEPLKIGDIGWNIGEANCENLRKLLTDLAGNLHLIIDKRDSSTEFEKVKNFYSWDDISLKTKSLYESIL